MYKDCMHIPIDYVRDISWEEVFSIWRKNEEHQAGWKEHWEERGFSSWEEWRKYYVAPLHPEVLSWKLYRVTDISLFPTLHGVPSRGWSKNCYGGEITKRLSDILNHPVVSQNPKVDLLEEHFPETTFLTALYNENMILIEGMHRSLALARRAQKGKTLSSEVYLIMAVHKGILPLLGTGDDKKE